MAGLHVVPVGINGDGLGNEVVQDVDFDNIEGAENFEDLFTGIENLKRQNFDIQGFIDIAHHPGPPHDEEEGPNEAELQGDMSQDLLTLAANILARLKSISKSTFHDVDEWNTPDMLQYDAILKVEQQLQNKSVYICVLGRYNVGKTTLINALLRNEVLPVSINPETAVTLYVQHDDKLESSVSSSSEPRLINCIEESLVAKGYEEVKKRLADLHRGVRGRSVSKQSNDYLLKIDFPLLKVTSERSENNPVPYLVDTPGSNEVGELYLQTVADLNLQSAAAYLFVMKYDDIKNKENYDALKMIYDRDPDIFRSERLTVVVTHYDISFQDKQSYMAKDVVKKEVANTISKVIKADVSTDIIIPVCGKWASNVRQCKSSSEKSCNDVQMSLLSVKSFQSGVSQFDLMKEVQSMPREQVLEEMEMHSMIGDLEDRIKLVSTRLSTVWRQNIVISCKKFLNSATELMEKLEIQVSQDLRDITDQTLQATKVVEYHKDMLKSIDRDSPILTQFREYFVKDTNYETKFRQRVEDKLLRPLNANLTEKQQVRKYSIQMLGQEINEVFLNDAMNDMKCWFFQTKFESCQRFLRRQTQRISEKFGRFRAAAALVVEHGGIPQTLANVERYLRGNEEEEGSDLNDVMESKISDLKQSELSAIIQKTYSIRMRLPLVKANVLKEDTTIAQIVEERRQALVKLHQDFFADIKETVVLHFFKTYCSVVINELGVFMKMMDRHGELLKLKDLLEQKKTLAPKSKQRQRYVQLKRHLEQLKAQLEMLNRHQR